MILIEIEGSEIHFHLKYNICVPIIDETIIVFSMYKILYCYQITHY